LLSSLPSPPTRSSSLSLYSDLSDREFQDVAESTLERLTDYLEEKLEELDVPGSDIEYSVRFPSFLPCERVGTGRLMRQDLDMRKVGRSDRQAGRQGNVRDQQATAEQANLAFFAN
jgi:hypothetical protein